MRTENTLTTARQKRTIYPLYGKFIGPTLSNEKEISNMYLKFSSSHWRCNRDIKKCIEHSLEI